MNLLVDSFNALIEEWRDGLMDGWKGYWQKTP